MLFDFSLTQISFVVLNQTYVTDMPIITSKPVSTVSQDIAAFSMLQSDPRFHPWMGYLGLPPEIMPQPSARLVTIPQWKSPSEEVPLKFESEEAEQTFIYNKLNTAVP